MEEAEEDQLLDLELEVGYETWYQSYKAQALNGPWNGCN